MTNPDKTVADSRTDKIKKSASGVLSLVINWLRTADRVDLLLLFTLVMALILCAGIVLKMLDETAGANSYALLAEAFLNGQLHTSRCFDQDCAKFDGRIFVFFPPFPAIIALPFVALFGVDFSGFIALGVLMAGFALLLWWRIFSGLVADRSQIVWLILALLTASPLYYVLIRGDGVWFFAQSTAFLLVTAALHEVLFSKRLWVAGLCIGAAFLSRQMSILYLPFLFALSLRANEPLISFRKEHIARALQLGIPVGGAVLIYLAYNFARFGHPLDTGYSYMVGSTISEAGDFIGHRIKDLGLFSRDYFLFNLFHLLAQGLHIQFGGKYMTEIVGVDPMGSSLLAASPFILLLFFMKMRRETIIALLIISAMTAVTLFYHSNGFSQYNVQRYTLDWLPLAFIFMPACVAAAGRGVFALLVAWGVGLNLVTMVALSLVHGT